MVGVRSCSPDCAACRCPVGVRVMRRSWKRSADARATSQRRRQRLRRRTRPCPGRRHRRRQEGHANRQEQDPWSTVAARVGRSGGARPPDRPRLGHNRRADQPMARHRAPLSGPRSPDGRVVHMGTQPGRSRPWHGPPRHAHSGARRGDVARWASEGTSRSSLIKIRSVLDRVLTYAERRGLAARNIAKLVELPAAARRTEPGRGLTVEQAKTLLSAAHGHRLEALFVTMLMLGLRPGEALGLSWHDVDLDHGIVHVRWSLKLHHGVLTVTDELKTSRSRRSLDAPPHVIDALHTRRVQQAGDRLPRGIGIVRPVPRPRVHDHSWHRHQPVEPARDLEKLTVHAGLGRWHPHELRHSAASIMSASGVPIEQIADVLGHDGTRMTALVYRHAVTPTVSAARRMGDVLS